MELSLRTSPTLLVLQGGVEEGRDITVIWLVDRCRLFLKAELHCILSFSGVKRARQSQKQCQRPGHSCTLLAEPCTPGVCSGGLHSAFDPACCNWKATKARLGQARPGKNGANPFWNLSWKGASCIPAGLGTNYEPLQNSWRKWLGERSLSLYDEAVAPVTWTRISGRLPRHVQ